MSASAFTSAAPSTPSAPPAPRAVMAILWALSGSHLLNDAVQAMLPAIYPLLKESFALSFTQIGLITLVFQGTASLLQPVAVAKGSLLYHCGWSPTATFEFRMCRTGNCTRHEGKCPASITTSSAAS